MNIIKSRDFDFSIIKRIPVLPVGKGRRTKAKKGVRYLDMVCAFDIETTCLEELEQSIMYIWQFQIDNLCTVIGRTWKEYREFIAGLETAAKADIVVFIHNASYEWQFLKTVFDFDEKDIFAMDTRKVLRFKSGKIEYRCSYLQSNMSLAKFTETMGVEHGKLSDFDYSVKRFPWTPLSDRELEYCVNDVRGLVEAVKVEMEKDGDTLYTIPLTSTGYVRRDVKKSVQVNMPHDWLQGILPDLHTYDMLLAAFRGGNTHASRFYAGEELKGVHSWDRSSSYPDVQCNCRFPVSRFEFQREPDEAMLQDLRKRNKAVLFSAVFYGIRLRDKYFGCPYLSESKCRQMIRPVLDNGRILKADQLETTLTDVDMLILEDVYNWDGIQIKELACARYGKLPKAITDPTISYYKKKTALKGTGSDEYLYMKSKNKLNSVYGMSAQRPVRLPIRFNPATETLFEDREADRNALLLKSNARAFQSYAFGVWVTAWARYRLHEGIMLAGDGFVYCDTDSVKYIGDVDWSGYNAQRIADSEWSGAWADDKDGKRHFMGVYEHDGEYRLFKTLGAKKYAYTDFEGKLHLTLAGVNKKKGAAELEQAGGLSAFQEGFIFYAGGGTESVYNDLPESKIITIEGRPVELTSNIVIRDSTYTLALTDDYRDVLSDAAMYRKVIMDLNIKS